MKLVLILSMVMILSACAMNSPAPTPTSKSTQQALSTSTRTPTRTPTIIPTRPALATDTRTPTSTPTPTPTPDPVPLGQAGHWRLVFSDDFEGQTLDETKWATCWSYGCATTHPSVWYSAANVIVGDGIVRLRADNLPQIQHGRVISYTSGMLSTGAGSGRTSPRFTAQYGYFEARVRVPAGRGLWPAFWMLTPEQHPPEIDIMEVLSKDPTGVHMHYHYIDGSGVLQDFGTAWNDGDFSADWHTFGLEWQPGAIIWYVDGMQRNRYDGDYVAAEPLYLILNLQVGGKNSWAGPADATTVFPAYYDIDYVYVWQQVAP
jgi:beta-glucanase (GH16 family)